MDVVSQAVLPTTKIPPNKCINENLFVENLFSARHVKGSWIFNSFLSGIIKAVCWSHLSYGVSLKFGFTPAKQCFSGLSCFCSIWSELPSWRIFLRSSIVFPSPSEQRQKQYSGQNTEKISHYLKWFSLLQWYLDTLCTIISWDGIDRILSLREVWRW